MDFIISDKSITVHLNKKDFTITNDNPNFLKVKQAIKNNDEEAVLRLLNTKERVEQKFGGKVRIEGNRVLYGDKELHGVVVNRILSFYNEGLPFEPLLRFAENLQQNPSKTAVDELYTFLEHRHLPITEDGCFLGYKGVRNDFLDIYSGKFDNSPGKHVSMERNDVDDDKNVHCSHGLHVGTIEYARSYAGCGQKVMVVKVNPKDCVSVPTDSGFQKLRTCGYDVLYECTNALDKPLYENDGVGAVEAEDDWNDSWSEEDNEDWSSSSSEENTEERQDWQKWLVVRREDTSVVLSSWNTRKEAREDVKNEHERVILNPDWKE